jgi:hypothetical protein
MPNPTVDQAGATDEVDVIFCSRLHLHQRPMAFVRMAITLSGTGTSSRFTLYGADEGELPAIRAAIDAAGVGDRVCWGGVLEPDASCLPTTTTHSSPPRATFEGTAERVAMGRRGRAAVEQSSDMSAVGDRLEEEYAAAADRKRS